MRVKNVGKIGLTLFSLIVLVTSCTRDNTDHPNHGKITSLTVDWSNRGAGINIPESYTVRIGEYSVVLSGTVNPIEHLFSPGRHTIYVYNAANGVTVNGIIATADYTVPGGIGWFFAGRKDIVIDRDTEYSFAVEMQQKVRQLTLELDITGDARESLIGVEGSLSGVARTINIDNNTIGTATSSAFSFTQTGNRFTSDMRLLGVASDLQTLSLTLHFADGNPASYTMTYDLSSRLATFNDDKRVPMTLSSIIVVTPTRTGVTTEISDWILGGTSVGVAD